MDKFLLVCIVLLVQTRFSLGQGKNTLAPSPDNFNAPSFTPTSAYPTEEPSVQRTRGPTSSEPTRPNPTQRPTIPIPTVSPKSSGPTEEPTREPTSTYAPSTTQEPSQDPTVAPTNPTYVPSSRPSLSFYPSSSPTITHEPTTANPTTCVPSSQPTVTYYPTSTQTAAWSGTEIYMILSVLILAVAIIVGINCCSPTDENVSRREYVDIDYVEGATESSPLNPAVGPTKI